MRIPTRILLDPEIIRKYKHLYPQSTSTDMAKSFRMWIDEYVEGYTMGNIIKDNHDVVAQEIKTSIGEIMETKRRLLSYIIEDYMIVRELYEKPKK